MAKSIQKLSVEQIRLRYFVERQPLSVREWRRLSRDRRAGVQALFQKLRREKEQEERAGRASRRRLRLEGFLHRSGIDRVAGVDEAGVGPLAGPVVAAAVIFPRGCAIDLVDDSKKLDEETRLSLEPLIKQRALCFAIGCCEVEEIDRFNIYHASLLAMRRAVQALPLAPQFVLTDSRSIPDLESPRQRAVHKGDARCHVIAAASILAKSHRDRLMKQFCQDYPGFGFSRHKGYCTPEHQQAIRHFGLTPIHRKSFPVNFELIGASSQSFSRIFEQLREVHSWDGLSGMARRIAAERENLSDAEVRRLRALLARRRKLLPERQMKLFS